MAKTGEEQSRAFGEQVRAHDIIAAEDRQSVVIMASRMFDALRGLDPNELMVFVEKHPRPASSSAPSEIPHFRWRGDFGDSSVQNGDLGSLFIDQWGNERPSMLVNAGFYAGVLAAKHGLVDVDAFQTDTDRRKASHQTVESVPSSAEQAALELLRQDRMSRNDDQFTPPGAIGQAIGGRDEGDADEGEDDGVREPAPDLDREDSTGTE